MRPVVLLDASLATTLVLAIAVGTIRCHGVPVVAPDDPRVEERTVEPTRRASASATRIDAALEIGVDPFRFSHEMPGLRLGEEPVPESIPGPAYRPALVLKGIVGGPPWTALVAGIPGNRGARLLSVGDRADSIMVRSIGSDSVVLSGPDTTWTLRLERGHP